ncbi:adenosine deaminase [Aeromonas salmonicida]|uniref:adenosine deaminase n=1 Tax=Aeromonas salmonicida TaxID=645 RepID=UPI000BB59615|nr:adenosine deaminase [Aeromonas salmonicida]ATD39080.1 adenosine deaminase [Aeromonas salmonicida subsp. masoucida]QOI94965.1 adenosine deaminase [Aeromonas salmonicida subsp. masoucida]
MQDDELIKESFHRPKQTKRNNAEQERKQAETRRRIEDILEEQAFNKLWNKE